MRKKTNPQSRISLPFLVRMTFLLIAILGIIVIISNSEL